MYAITASLATAFCIVFFIIPSIIEIALKKNLYDQPNQRSSHRRATPSLGGFAVFVGFILGVFFWVDEISYLFKYLLCATLIVAVIGLKDDIVTLSPSKKILGQMIAILILIHFANIRIDSFFGIFGVGEIPGYLSYSFTLIFMLTLVNGFNLIDGINGLAGSVALLTALVFGSWFYWVGLYEEALIAFTLIGALSAFLYYNFTPAKIFMGDTGSLLIGLIAAVLCVQFLSFQELSTADPFIFSNAPIIALAVLILPLFDTVRVFFIRLFNGKSPFQPDRSHLHHMLIDMNLSHMKATGILVGINITFILLAFLLQGVVIEIQLVLVLGLAIGLSVLIQQVKKNFEKDHAVSELLSPERNTETNTFILNGRNEVKAIPQNKS